MPKSIIALLLIGCSSCLKEPNTALCKNYSSTKICLETKDKIINNDKPDVMLKIVVKVNY
jgi:hypothetical protein